MARIPPRAAYPGQQQNALVPRQAPAQPYPQQPPPAQLTYAPQPQGYPQQQGPGLGGPPAVDPRQAYDIRTSMANMEQRVLQHLSQQLAGVEQRIARGEARIEDVVRAQPNSALAGLGQVTPQAQQLFAQALADGRVMPYFLTIDIPLAAGCSGEEVLGSTIATSSGPVIVSMLWATAIIDIADAKAANVAAALIQVPSCNAAAGCDGFSELDDTATFTINPNVALPSLDARGLAIPIDAAECEMIVAGTQDVCGTLTCAGQADTNFDVRLPILMLDHPDCISGLVEISVNGCDWQNVPFPLGLLAQKFDITNEVPDCLGLGGYLGCQKELDVGITPLRAPLFNTIVSVCFAGFRLVGCDNAACGTGVVANVAG